MVNVQGPNITWSSDRIISMQETQFPIIYAYFRIIHMYINRYNIYQAVTFSLKFAMKKKTSGILTG